MCRKKMQAIMHVALDGMPTWALWTRSRVVTLASQQGGGAGSPFASFVECSLSGESLFCRVRSARKL
eukprot:COSAG05_NODE_3326_length_2148_cov_8.383602_3_plen_67_part_00